MASDEKGETNMPTPDTAERISFLVVVLTIVGLVFCILFVIFHMWSSMIFEEEALLQFTIPFVLSCFGCYKIFGGMFEI